MLSKTQTQEDIQSIQHEKFPVKRSSSEGKLSQEVLVSRPLPEPNLGIDLSHAKSNLNQFDQINFLSGLNLANTQQNNSQIYEHKDLFRSFSFADALAINSSLNQNKRNSANFASFQRFGSNDLVTNTRNEIEEIQLGSHMLSNAEKNQLDPLSLFSVGGGDVGLLHDIPTNVFNMSQTQFLGNGLEYDSGQSTNIPAQYLSTGIKSVTNQPQSKQYIDNFGYNTVSSTIKNLGSSEHHESYNDLFLSGQTCYSTPETIQSMLSPATTNALGLGLVLDSGSGIDGHTNADVGSAGNLEFNPSLNVKDVDLSDLLLKCQLLEMENTAQLTSSIAKKRHLIDEFQECNGTLGYPLNLNASYGQNYNDSYDCSTFGNTRYLNVKRHKAVNSISYDHQAGNIRDQPQEQAPALHKNVSGLFSLSDSSHLNFFPNHIYDRARASNGEHTDLKLNGRAHHLLTTREGSVQMPQLLAHKTSFEMGQTSNPQTNLQNMPVPASKSVPKKEKLVGDNLQKSKGQCDNLENGPKSQNQEILGELNQDQIQNNVKAEFEAMEGGKQRHKLIKCPHEGCDGTFKSLSFLKSHMNTHTKVRPFQCSYCPASFSRKHDLKRHTRIHTGDKPHKCKYCGRGFARTDALSRHSMYGPCSAFYSRKLLCMLNMNMDMNMEIGTSTNANLNMSTGIGMNMGMNMGLGMGVDQIPPHFY